MRDRRILVLVTLVAVAALGGASACWLVVARPARRSGVRPAAVCAALRRRGAVGRRRLTPTGAASTTSSAAAWRRSTADADGLIDLYFAGGEPARGAVREPQHGRRRARIRAPRGRGDRPRRPSPARIPLDIDSDGIDRSCRAAPRRQRLLRGLGRLRFEHANERMALRWRRRLVDCVQRHAGTRAPSLADDGRRQLPRRRPIRTSLGVRRQRSFALTHAGTGFAPAVALSPGWCTLSMLFSDWNRSGRRDLRVSNDRHYYPTTATARSSCGACRPTTAPRQYDARRRLADGSHLGHGHRQQRRYRRRRCPTTT